MTCRHDWNGGRKCKHVAADLSTITNLSPRTGFLYVHSTPSWLQKEQLGLAASHLVFRTLPGVVDQGQ